MTKPIRKTAIIGTGGIAKAHLWAIKSMPERLQLAAVCDVDLEKATAFAEEAGGAEVFTDSAEMLRSVKPDLVQICTPPMLHASLAVQAMRAQADVLIEKPICGSLAELDEIEAAAKETGRTYASVFQFRSALSAAKLRGHLQDGSAGRPLVALCETLWFRDHPYYHVPWRGKWSTELGGPTMGHGIHAMDLFLFLLGEWSEVRAMAATVDRDIEVEDVSTALVRFANGAQGVIVNSILSPREETYLRIDTQHLTAELTCLYSFNADNWKLTPAPAFAKDDGLDYLVEDGGQPICGQITQLPQLLDDLDCGRTPMTSGIEARRTLDFLTSLYKSALTGQPVLAASIVPGDPFYTSIHGNMQPMRLIPTL